MCISSVSFFGVVGGHLASKQNGGRQDGRTFGSRRNTRLRTRHWRSCSGRAGLWDSTLRYIDTCTAVGEKCKYRTPAAARHLYAQVIGTQLFPNAAVNLRPAHRSNRQEARVPPEPQYRLSHRVLMYVNFKPRLYVRAYMDHSTKAYTLLSPHSLQHYLCS